MYLVGIIDWYSRYLVGYCLTNSLEKTAVIEAIKKAIKRHGTPEIINSDQGPQFTSDVYINLLKENKIKISSLIAQELNISRPSVINYIHVNRCIDEIIELFDSNLIGIAEINKIYKLSNTEQLEYYNRVIEQNDIKLKNDFQDIKNQYINTNKVPVKRNVKKYGKFIYKYKRWNKALIAAKITPRYATKFTKEDIIKALQELAKKLGRTPTMLDIKKAKKEGLYIPHAINICYIFKKNWNEILIEAGLNINRAGSRNKYKDMTDQEILQMVKNELLRLNTSSSSYYEKYRDKELPSVVTLYRKFGKWSEMMNILDKI
jgi:predicted transcriptional regulator